MTKDVQRQVSARAYCSTANLGAGFDVFGLALDQYADVVTVHFVNEGGVRVRLSGAYYPGIPSSTRENSGGAPAIEMLRRAGLRHGVEVMVEKGVPPGLGLGSSGATASACAKAMDSLLQLELGDDQLVEVASLGEKAVSGHAHADNVAASCLGGFTVVYDHAPVRVFSVKPPRNLSVIVTTPRVHLPSGKTKLARKILPDKVPVQASVHNTGRASAIVAGFVKGDIGLIGSGMNDEIAEPYREKLIPGYRYIKKAALNSEAAGVAISGAGPSIIALVDNHLHDPIRIGKAMVREFSKHNVESSFFVSRPAGGARILDRQRRS